MRLLACAWRSPFARWMTIIEAQQKHHRSGEKKRTKQQISKIWNCISCGMNRRIALESNPNSEVQLSIIIICSQRHNFRFLHHAFPFNYNWNCCSGSSQRTPTYNNTRIFPLPEWKASWPPLASKPQKPRMRSYDENNDGEMTEARKQIKWIAEVSFDSMLDRCCDPPQ